MSTTLQQAQTLIDYLAMPSVRKQQGADTCDTLQANLWMYMNSATPDEAAPLLEAEILATRDILRMGMK